MRLRGTLAAGALAAGLALAGVLFWPLLSQRIVAAVEDRLSRETGRAWTVAGGIGAGLSPAPYVTLHDLSTTDAPGAYAASIRTVRLNGAPGLLFGASEGRVQAVVEGLRLRLPLSLPLPVKGAPRLSDGTGPALDGVRAVRVVLRGAEAALADADTVLVLSLAGADVSLDLGADAGRTEIRAVLERPDADTVLELDLARTGASSSPSSSPLRLALTPKAGGHVLTADATAMRTAEGLRLDGVTGRFDGEPFSGLVSLEAGALRPRIGLDLRLKALSLTDSQGVRPRAGGAGLVVPVRTDIVPDPAWFSAFDASATIAVGRLGLGPLSVGGVVAKAAVKDGSLDAAVTAETVYEGGGRARYVLAPAGGAGKEAGKEAARGGALHQVSLSLSNVRASPLLSDLAGVRAIDGAAALRLDVQAQGLSLDAIARAARGSADVRLTDGHIDGLDVAGLVGLIPTDAASGQRASGLVTAFSTLGGAFRIEDGHALTDDLALKTNLLEAKGVGSIDILGRTLDMQLKPTLVVPGRSRAGGRGALSVPVRVSGPWTNPAVAADFSGLMNDPQGALGALQELGGSILGGQGFGGTGSPGQGQAGGDAGNSGLGGLLDALMPGQKPARPGRPGGNRP